MNLGILTKANSKGQIVIPKEYRRALAITEEVPLQVVMEDNAIHIHVVKKIVRHERPNESFAEILRRTRGSWAATAKEDIRREKAQRRIELAATRRNQKAW